MSGALRKSSVNESIADKEPVKVVKPKLKVKIIATATVVKAEETEETKVD